MVLRVCKEGEQILAWLTEHEWMLHGFEGEGACLRTESSRLEREAPHEKFARKTSDVAGEETCRLFGNGFLKMGREGKAMQRLGMED